MSAMPRRAIWIEGTVQGVGFRPFVFGLAASLRLGGFVRNRAGGVQIEVEGDDAELDCFLSDLRSKPPPLARIDSIHWAPLPAIGDIEFRIEQSACDAAGFVVISADIATCDDCLRELFDPSDRRYRYPFLNCTNCGPRLTIVRGAPYDRERTTMASFPMCAACRSEYDNPLDRRFHAQPIACPACGPRLWGADEHGTRIESDDWIRWAAEEISAGKIIAIKGIGGYHLACDARSEEAIAELRRRKLREEKPLAIMVRDASEAERFCEISGAERELLTSNRRPIVLLAKRLDQDSLPELLAPRNPGLGIMLPYTPLHHLLLAELEGAPLVMTSGNRSNEPIATSEPEVFHRLAGIADAFLVHDRPIHVRCDDSVTQVINAIEAPLRRSRGMAPSPVRLPHPCHDTILAVGGQLKGTFALARASRAIVSHHLGDLDQFEAYRAFERDVELYESVFDLHPKCIVHDLHPDYASSRYAIKRAKAEGLTLVAVQHHHAHMASCMAEHEIDGPVIGVTLDGTGYGTDGAIWGGEFLVGDFASFHRAAHLRYVAMPGGESAVREPWRMALAHLADAHAPCVSLQDRVDPMAWRVARQLLEKRLIAPLTSSAGRLFDAVASIVGLRDVVSFEGQAAMELECIAGDSVPDQGYCFELREDRGGGLEVDTRPLIRAVADEMNHGIPREKIARRFHASIVEMVVSVCSRIRDERGITTAVLSGGVFANRLLCRSLDERLHVSGIFPLRQRVLPSNDGGLCLGQLAIAARRLS